MGLRVDLSSCLDQAPGRGLGSMAGLWPWHSAPSPSRSTSQMAGEYGEGGGFREGG